MAQVICRRPLTFKPQVIPHRICGGQSVNGTDFSPRSSVFQSISFHDGSPRPYINWRTNAGGRSSETKSHPSTCTGTTMFTFKWTRSIKPQRSHPSMFYTENKRHLSQNNLVRNTSKLLSTGNVFSATYHLI
jgi:hypothetical protein